MDKVVQYYNQIAEIYFNDRFNNSYGKFIDYQERNILNQLITNKNELVLDLACGSGRFLNYANIGIDASHKMIEQSKQKYLDKKLIICDAENMQIESSSIDTIICFHFFMHIDQSKFDLILKECRRVLKKNGRLIFDIPSQKRRHLIKTDSNSWHGSTSKTIKEIQQIEGFNMNKFFGVMFIPIHRFPIFIRKFLLKIDIIISNSFLKEYSSYLVFELINTKNENF